MGFGIITAWSIVSGVSSIKHVDGLLQNCSNSIANGLELLQACTEALI